MLGPKLESVDLAAFEREVIPDYLSRFDELALAMLDRAETASLMHVGCRIGHLHGALARSFPNLLLVGLDPSPDALEKARQVSMAGRYELTVAEDLAAVENASFSHVLTVHPICSGPDRIRLLAESRRVLKPGGQLVVAVPLRGSFIELLDMFREFSLRSDLPDVTEAVEVVNQLRPSVETLAPELEQAGFVDIDIEVRLDAVRFESGRAFGASAVANQWVFPDAIAGLGTKPNIITSAVEYAKAALAKYWSEGEFELTVNVGCASARAPT